MSSSAEEARGTAGNLSPATRPRKDRVRLELHVLGTDDSGSDDHFSSERRGTPHETTEGRDRGDTTRSDHPDHLHREAASAGATRRSGRAGSTPRGGEATRSNAAVLARGVGHGIATRGVNGIRQAGKARRRRSRGRRSIRGEGGLRSRRLTVGKRTGGRTGRRGKPLRIGGGEIGRRGPEWRCRVRVYVMPVSGVY